MVGLLGYEMQCASCLSSIGASDFHYLNSRLIGEYFVDPLGALHASAQRFKRHQGLLSDNDQVDLRRRLYTTLAFCSVFQKGALRLDIGSLDAILVDDNQFVEHLADMTAIFPKAQFIHTYLSSGLVVVEQVQNMPTRRLQIQSPSVQLVVDALDQLRNKTLPEVTSLLHGSYDSCNV